MTIKEVAALAGVSPAAVSRYMNGGSISEEKRERIRAVIERTGYRPNPAAQTMRTGRCDEIGVIVPKIDSDSVSAIVAGISEGLKDKNYMVVLGSTAGVREEEIRYLSAMQSSNVAGIILMGTVMTPFLKDAIAASEKPVVVTGQNFEGVPSVFHDDFNAVKELMNRMMCISAFWRRILQPVPQGITEPLPHGKRPASCNLFPARSQRLIRTEASAAWKNF